MRRLRVSVGFLAILGAAACSSNSTKAPTPDGSVAGPSDAGPGTNDGGTDAATSVQPISGFDLQVMKEGSWWQFARVVDGHSFSTSGNATLHGLEMFVLTLGAKTTLGGDEAYPLSFALLTHSGDSDLSKVDWNYISFVGKRIRVSADGTTWSVLFDANTGIWPATSRGMFGDFPSSTATRKAVQQGSRWIVGETNGSTGCEVIPPYGTVCGGSGDINNSANETYDPAIGLVGSYFFGSTSNTSGSSQVTRTTTLVDSSVAADRPLPKAGNSCVDINVPTTTNLQVIAQSGNPPPAMGGPLTDGSYVATAVRVYGTGMTPGMVTGSYAGTMRLAASVLELAYQTSTPPATYYAAGTFTLSSATANATYTCESSGSTSASFDYSVTGPTTIDITAVATGYTTVTTFMRQ
jgi:hypothetical protein